LVKVRLVGLVLSASIGFIPGKALAQRPDISFIWGYYILSISCPQKRILNPIHIQAPKKDIDIYPISFVSSAARKWQITAEMAETAVLKEKSCLWNPKSRALNAEKRI
jgi:hypothetical protein